MFSSALLHLRLSAVNVGDEIVFFCWVGGGGARARGSERGAGRNRWEVGGDVMIFDRAVAPTSSSDLVTGSTEALQRALFVVVFCPERGGIIVRAERGTVLSERASIPLVLRGGGAEG